MNFSLEIQLNREDKKGHPLLEAEKRQELASN